MEENKSLLSKTALSYGIGLGGLLVLLELLFYSLDVDRESKIRWVSIIIVVGVMLYGVKGYRDNILNGFITYGKSVKLCFLIGLFSAVIVSVFMYFFIKFFDPGLIEQILEQSEEKLLNSSPNIGDEELDLAMAYTKKFTTALWISVGTLFMLAVQSIILALIISIFMKKKDDSFEATIN